MKEKKPSMQIPVIFQNIKEYEHEDSRFLKVKIWLMHTGENFNGSSFSKEVVNKQLHTLANTPILAFIEENSNGELDFSDHRMVLHRTTEGDIEVKYLGTAVGVIPENNNAKWEKRVTDQGEELEYLTVEALMWKKWDDPINIMRKKGFTSQSMELSDRYTGSWDEDGVFHFESFEFFGACLLGEDVMPAMKSSVAEIQFSKNKNIQKSIEDKLQEFYTLFSHEGGNNEMPKENKQDKEKVKKDYGKTEVEPDIDNVEAAESNKIEEAVEEAEKTKTTEEATNETQNENTTETSSDNPDNSTETSETFEDEPPTVESEEATEKNEVSSVEVTEDKISVEAKEITIEDKPLDNSTETDYEGKFNESQAELDKIKSEYTSLQSQFEKLQKQLVELQEFKRNREEADLKAKFEGKLSDEELNQVFTEMKDSELGKVEEKLFAMIGKKNFSIESTNKNNTNVNKIGLNYQKEEQPKPYGGLLEMYKDK